MFCILTVKDVADDLKLSIKKTYSLVHNDSFPKIIIGKSIRIDEIEYEKWKKRWTGRKIKI